MSAINIPLRWLAAASLTLALLSATSASAFEAHNQIEPPIGPFGQVHDSAVDQSNGNVYAADSRGEQEKDKMRISGAEGGAPAAGAPSGFTIIGSFPYERPFGVAVDNACALRGLSGSECASFDPSDGDIYIKDTLHEVVDRYRLNGSGEDEYLCDFKSYGTNGNMCLADAKQRTEFEVNGGLGAPSGVAVDSAGDLYVARTSDIVEFNAAGEGVQQLGLPENQEYPESLAVAPDGTIYAEVYDRGATSVVELKRGSLTGAAEGEAAVVPHTSGATAVAFDQARGQLLVDLGSFGEALDGAHEVVSRFGSGVIAQGGGLAVDEGSGEIYVANQVENVIDRFGPGVAAALPAVDQPPPSLASVTRTSALLTGTIDPGGATTTWRLEYAAAGEYQPGAANPYASGGRTPPAKLAASPVGTSVGPLPLTGLLASTTYHYRLVASNELGTTYGQDHTFTTAAASPPVVVTGAASEVTQTGVLLSGTVDARELQTSYEFEVGVDAAYGGAKLFGNAGNGGTETINASLQYLIPGTTYHYRLLASNEDGTSYGQDMTFTTPDVASPIAQPPTATLIPSAAVTFPSIAGAITKAQGAGRHPGRSGKRRRTAGARKRHGRRGRAGRHGSARGGGKGR
jgi:hypothetical protein